MEVIRHAAEETLLLSVQSANICHLNKLHDMQRCDEPSPMLKTTAEGTKTEIHLKDQEKLAKVVSQPRLWSPDHGQSEPKVKPTVEPPQAVAQTPEPVPLTIKAGSPFSPSSWDCSTCHERNAFSNTHCHGPACGAPFKWSNTIITSRGDRLDPARFPVHWVCGCCSRQHLVLFIISGRNDTYCICGQPTLQAVYDQFGDLFLYWRDDIAVKDLRDRKKAEEAARRLWLAGGDRWAVFPTFSTNLPKIHLDEKQEKEEELVTALTRPIVMC